MRVFIFLSIFLNFNLALSSERKILIEPMEYCGVKFPEGTELEVDYRKTIDFFYCRFNIKNSQVTIHGLTGSVGQIISNNSSGINLTEGYIGQRLKIPSKCHVSFKFKTGIIRSISCSSEKAIIEFNDVKYTQHLSVNSSIYPSGTLAEPATFFDFKWPAGTKIDGGVNLVTFEAGADVVFKGHKYIKGCRFHFRLPDGKVTDILGPNDHI